MTDKIKNLADLEKAIEDIQVGDIFVGERHEAINLDDFIRYSKLVLEKIGELKAGVRERIDEYDVKNFVEIIRDELNVPIPPEQFETKFNWIKELSELALFYIDRRRELRRVLGIEK